MALGCGVCGHSLREPLPQPQGLPPGWLEGGAGFPAAPLRWLELTSASGVHMSFCTQSMETFHDCQRKQKLLILPSTAEVPFVKLIPKKQNNLKRGIF